ncbi:amino acid permease-domain-containing protein [Syncephalis plumigaleata]|nr:amino acid permease-domain-containing protein [Syncephalis plumigaleata]
MTTEYSQSVVTLEKGYSVGESKANLPTTPSATTITTSSSSSATATATGDQHKMENGEPALTATMGIPSGISIVVGMIVGSGIFSTPGFVWQLVGSPGMALVMWVIGGVISYMGALCYVELGTMLPKSGGEQAYLAYVYKRPRELFAFIFCWCTIICIQPNSTAANSVVFGSYILYAIYGDRGEIANDQLRRNFDWYARGIGLVTATIITLICILSTKWSLRMQNTITGVKVVILLIFAITGIVILAGGMPSVPDPGNWREMFVGTTTDVSNYANAMFNVFWAYGGWNALNFCVGELRNPQRDLPIASFGGMTIVTLLYFFANVAYIAVVPEKLAFESREILAGTFSNIVFGLHFGRVTLPVLIALSTYGSIAASVFTASRVIQIAAQEGQFPFPRVFDRVHQRVNTPVNALILNWLLVLLFMFAPPPGEVFDFLISMSGYPQALFFAFTIAGLLVLRRTEPEKERPFRVWWIIAVIFLVFSAFLAVFPFVPPTNYSGSTPYYLPSLLGLFFLLTGIPGWYIIVIHEGSIKRAWSACIALVIGRKSSQVIQHDMSMPIMKS